MKILKLQLIWWVYMCTFTVLTGKQQLAFVIILRNSSPLSLSGYVLVYAQVN